MASANSPSTPLAVGAAVGLYPGGSSALMSSTGLALAKRLSTGFAFSVVVVEVVLNVL